MAELGKKMEQEIFEQLKASVAYQLKRKVRKKGWKRNLCRRYEITFHSIMCIINGTQKEPPFTSPDYKDNDNYYVKHVMSGKAIRCSFCNKFVASNSKHKSRGKKFCSADCLRLSNEFHEHLAKEPHPFTLEKSGRVIGMPKKDYK